MTAERMSVPSLQQALAPPGREGFPHDSTFPQLPIATDAELMRDVFASHLRPVGGRSYRIMDCVPFRFRCHQGTSRCVLQYTLHVLDLETGRRWDQWVTGLLYARAGEAERLWREMQAADPSRGIPEPWLAFEPVGFVPDLQMAVEVFPYDRKLGNLRVVMGDALRGLEPRLLERLGEGQWSAESRARSRPATR
jgi:hypothetical protein